MKKQSAGILAYRVVNDHCEVFLIHPGGPLWKKREKDAWSIPKGEFDNDEEPFDAAIREFKEETGHDIDGDFWEMEPVIQKGGKTVYAWAVKADWIPLSQAQDKMFKGQEPLIDQLADELDVSIDKAPK
mgnify:CR=1 FL=1